MTKYNTLALELSNSQLNELKSTIKKGTEVTLNLLSNLIGSSNDEINFPHKLLLTNTQVSNIRKAFANSLSAYQLFKTQLIQLGGILGDLLAAIPQAMVLIGKEVLKRELKTV